MFFILLVLALAVGVALLRGGRFGNLATAPLRATWLLFVGVGLQLAADLGVMLEWLTGGAPATYGLLLLSHLVVLVWVVLHWYLPGVLLVSLGLLLNATVMAANGAMPVHPAALETIGFPADELGRGKHVVLDQTTNLPWLADVWPVAPIGAIISIGDVVLAAGLLPVTHALMTYRPPARRRTPGPASEVTPRETDDPGPG